MIYISPFEGVVSSLRTLCDSGRACVVVSNKGMDAIRHSLEAHELLDIIRFVVGDQPDVPKKPNPEILHKYIIPQFDRVDQDRILMVGDTEADIQFARNAKIASCWVRYGYGHADKCSALAPNYRIDRFGELLEIVGAA